MKRIITFLIVLVMIFSGCTTTTPGPNEVNYRTGTEGLEIEFPIELPTEIYENDKDVQFMVEVENRGAFPQLDEEGDFEGYLWIGGYDPDIIDINPDNGERLSEIELEGKSVYNERGGSTVVEFDANVYDLPSGTPYYKPKIILTTTYLYKTVASPVICVDAEPRSTYIKNKVCTVSDVGLSSQGAPIAVTNIEIRPQSDVILFNIDIKNSGGGLVIPQQDVDVNPNLGYDWRELDEIKIDEIKVGDIRMSSCRPDIGDEVQLINDEARIYCRLDMGLVGNQVYTTPLNIILSYGYSNSETREIEIFEEIGY
jgi:hypothetical protein